MKELRDCICMQAREAVQLPFRKDSRAHAGMQAHPSLSVLPCTCCGLTWCIELRRCLWVHHAAEACTLAPMRLAYMVLVAGLRHCEVNARAMNAPLKVLQRRLDPVCRHNADALPTVSVAYPVRFESCCLDLLSSTMGPSMRSWLLRQRHDSGQCCESRWRQVTGRPETIA